MYGYPRDLHVLTHPFPTLRSSDLQSLRANDMQAFSRQWLPDDLRQRTEAAFDAQRQAMPPADEKDRAEFAQTMSKLTAVDAEKTLYAELEPMRSEEHTSELQSLMRISYAVFCLKKKKTK